MILNNIKTFIKFNPILFALFIVAQIIGVLMLLSAYGIYFNNEYELENNAALEKQIYISFYQDDVEQNKELVRSIKENFPQILDDFVGYLSYVNLYGTLSCKHNEESPQFSFQTEFDYDGKSYLNVPELLPDSRFLNGEWFTDDDLNSGALKCIVGMTGAEIDAFAADKLEIGETKYEIIGRPIDNIDLITETSNFAADINIPLESMPEETMLEGMTVVFDRALTATEYNSFMAKLNSAMGDHIEAATDFYVATIDDKNRLKNMMIIVALIALLSAYSTCKIYKYILDSRLKETAVFMITGAKTRQILFMYFGEIVVLQIISNFCGLALFKTVAMKILVTKFVWLELVFSKHYEIILIAIYLAVTFTIAAVNVYKCIRHTPIEALKKSGTTL